MAEITSSSQEQASGIEEVSKAVAQIDQFKVDVDSRGLSAPLKALPPAGEATAARPVTAKPAPKPAAKPDKKPAKDEFFDGDMQVFEEF